MDRVRSLLIFKVKGQISRSLGLYKEFWHLDPCGQDIARTIWHRMLKLSVYTLYGQRKKPIYFQGQRSNIKVTGPTIWPRVLRLSVYTLYGQRKKPILFKVKGQISRSLGLYKEFWHLDPCGQDIARTIWQRMLKLGVYTLYGQRKKPIYFQGQRANFKVTGPLQRILALGSLWAGYRKNYTA